MMDFYSDVCTLYEKRVLTFTDFWRKKNCSHSNNGNDAKSQSSR